MLNVHMNILHVGFKILVYSRKICDNLVCLSVCPDTSSNEADHQLSSIATVTIDLLLSRTLGVSCEKYLIGSYTRVLL